MVFFSWWSLIGEHSPLSPQSIISPLWHPAREGCDRINLHLFYFTVIMGGYLQDVLYRSTTFTVIWKKQNVALVIEDVS